ncbi:general substrate transporter [Punctularia strigosozonata HHB-11173 SS5]|uniref:general substrate transporter n=1 Tax=Punctularia strigosozonata (strain HHB-11173) TaxID=741275 RepID=UPI0004416CEB|nr:general substrate transporter [Punctularia strigosozonata HHB-11173 SS5]EIN08311.1 general substrate transporter [Punctularia strigosozonata HHB-11173 SS5]
MIGFAAGSGFLLFGYDQGVMSGLLTLPSLVQVFPQIDTTSSETSKALRSVFTRASSFSLGQLIAGRIITGVGNGMHMATIPMWQSECSPPHKRGMLVMVEGLLISGGICLAYWIDFAFFWVDPVSSHTTYDLNDYPHRSASWRAPIAFQVLLCLPTLITNHMPESPRWLMLKDREDEGRRVMASLDELPLDDPEIDFKMQEIRKSLVLAQGGGLKDIFKQGKEKNFHRMALGFVNQMFQQISGINLITYYAATIYETKIGMSPLISRIVAACNGTGSFLASFMALWTIERFGRRKLMLIGAAGQCLCMIVLAICTSPAALQPEGGNPQNPAANHGPAYVAAFILFFESFNALRERHRRAIANWIFNFIIVVITPIPFANIFYKTYIIFAVIDAAITVTTYYIFPETATRSLEEMSEIFEHASVWNPYDVVQIERRTPRRYDADGCLLARRASSPSDEESSARSYEVREKTRSLKVLERSGSRDGTESFDASETTSNI